MDPSSGTSVPAMSRGPYVNQSSAQAGSGLVVATHPRFVESARPAKGTAEFYRQVEPGAVALVAVR